MNNYENYPISATVEQLRICVKNTFKTMRTLKHLGMSEEDIEKLLDDMALKYSHIWEASENG